MGKRSKTPDVPVDIAAHLARAEEILGHRFADQELLRRALTHPSAAEGEDNGGDYYERLEFLGDSILGFVIASEVFKRFPDMDEGGMTRVRITVVNGATLSEIAATLGLDEAIVLGKSEQGTGQRGLTSALENMFEALTAALYLDAGFEAARDWVLSTLGPRITEDAANQPENPKSSLQELLQSHGCTPTYRIVRHEGPPHDRTFYAEVSHGDERLGMGSGRTKQEAEKAAADDALGRLSADPEMLARVCS